VKYVTLIILCPVEYSLLFSCCSNPKRCRGLNHFPKISFWWYNYSDDTCYANFGDVSVDNLDIGVK